MKNIEFWLLAVLVLLEIAVILWMRWRSDIRKPAEAKAFSAVIKHPGSMSASTDKVDIAPPVAPPSEGHKFPGDSLEWERVSFHGEEEVPRLDAASERVEILELSEIDLMIEDAEQYAIHGRLNKAIGMLNDIVRQYPTRTEVWLLLLSIYRNDKSVHQFEATARRYLKVAANDDCWRLIQEAGRSIDPKNKLYFDSQGQVFLGQEKQRLLGRALVDINAISERVLKISLAHYDQMKHGKLGNYLLARGLIKPNHLDEALRHQHNTVSDMQGETGRFVNAVKPGWIGDVLVQMGAVTESELSHVLGGFDPKVHGYFGNHLVAIKLISQKQLHIALLQQLSHDMRVN